MTDFEIGKIFKKRKDILGNKGQCGPRISMPSEGPFYFLFTADLGTKGKMRGHFDEDDSKESGVFTYTGEKQVGVAKFESGNAGIARHAERGKTLVLFKVLKVGGFECLGEFIYLSHKKLTYRTDDGKAEEDFVFRLMRADKILPDSEVSISTASLEDLRSQIRDHFQNHEDIPSSEAKRRIYLRSRLVHSYALKRADGKCESCGCSAPFLRKDGTPYLESHHTEMISEGGPDHPRWVGAICPNCHREMHVGAEGKDKNKRLKDYLQEYETRYESVED